MHKKCPVPKALKALDRIDALKESGKITKKQHDKRSKAVLIKMMKSKAKK